MKTYLVTGGAGFIGSNHIIYLLQKYQKIKIVNLDVLTYAGNLENLATVDNDIRYTFIQGDICDKEVVDSIFRNYGIDYVINFAAESHVDRSIENPDIFATTNILGTLNLLNTARKYWSLEDGKYKDGVKFLQVGTDEVYGDLPLDKPGIMFTEDTAINPSSPYSASKASADFFVAAYNRTYKMPVNITRCSNNYGPYQFPEKLIPLMINNAMNHQALPIYGDGMQVRDWLHVEDHCRAIDLVTREGVSGEVYNIGGHNEHPNIFVVKSIIGYINKHVDDTVTEELIIYVEDRKGHDKRYAINPSKIKKDLGWEPVIMFNDGIKETIQWYIKNGQWMENITTGEYQEYYDNMYGSRKWKNRNQD